MVPTAGAARGEAFADWYQGQHAGKDVLSSLMPGMAPRPAELSELSVFGKGSM